MHVQNVQAQSIETHRLWFNSTSEFVKKLNKIKRLKIKIIMRLLLQKTLLCKLIQIRNLFCYKLQKRKSLTAIYKTRNTGTGNRMQGMVGKVGLIRNLLQCKNKIRNSKEAYKRAKEKKTDTRLACIFDTC